MAEVTTSRSFVAKSPQKALYRAAMGGNALKGEAIVPGDKSISHRAIMFGALAEGETTVEGLLEGEDVLRNAAAMRALGADIECDYTKSNEKNGKPENTKPVWKIKGPIFGDQIDASALLGQTLYYGNGGTGARIGLGLVAGLISTIDAHQRKPRKPTGNASASAEITLPAIGFNIGFDGDQSLRSRPMGRILEPLRQMGAVASSEDNKLPISLVPSAPLQAIEYQLPVPSAQIKSAVLLAALNAKGTTVIDEPIPSRDHTENMLSAFGVTIEIAEKETGRHISLKGGQKLTATHIIVPADPSSAAFIIAAALIIPDSDITLPALLMNPMRTGFITTMREMGADIIISNERRIGGEAIADIRVRNSQLRGIDVPPERAPSMIDEYPVLAIVAAFAKGDTLMPGIGELRVKESDRIDAMEKGLTACGVEVESGKDWLLVKGGHVREKTHKDKIAIKTYHDHRIAMSFLVFSMATRQNIIIDDAQMIATSFPNFFDIFEDLGARFLRA